MRLYLSLIHFLSFTHFLPILQATQGGGGWPMSVFLTPELKPFVGGTYFPPRDAYGRPGFPTLLKSIAEQVCLCVGVKKCSSGSWLL